MNMIKALCIPLTVLALSAGSALADGKGHGDKGHSKKPKAHHATQFCPPGLAKKSPACIPPGQAKKYGYDDDEDRYGRDDRYDGDGRRLYYRLGDVVRDDCTIVPYTRYRSLPVGTYCRYEERLMRIDPETRASLTILDILSNN